MTTKANKRQRKNKRTTRKNAGFFWAPAPVAPVQRQGGPNLTGNFSTFEYGIPGVIGHKTYTNSQGKTYQQVTGIPQTVGMLQLAMNPRGALKSSLGQPSSTVLPPNYFLILGLSGDFTPAQLQSAYNAKKNVGTNIDKKTAKNAFNTLSDPTLRQQYETSMKAYYAANPPNGANIVKMMRQSGRSNPLLNMLA